MHRTHRSAFVALSTTLAAALLALSFVSAGCLSHDSKVGASYDRTTEQAVVAAKGDAVISASGLRALADKQRKRAAQREWLARKGAGSGGMFDISGDDLRDAAGLSADELQEEARTAMARAQQLEVLACRVDSGQEIEPVSLNLTARR